jgi:hypothetical protein
VLRLDEAVVVAEGEALGVVESLLELGCEFVEAHGVFPEEFDLPYKMGE